MKLLSRLLDAIAGRGSERALLPRRRERREEARRRHRAAHEALWTADDRIPGPDGERWVADVASGTPGHFGSVRTTRDD